MRHAWVAALVVRMRHALPSVWSSVERLRPKGASWLMLRRPYYETAPADVKDGRAGGPSGRGGGVARRPISSVPGRRATLTDGLRAGRGIAGRGRDPVVEDSLGRGDDVVIDRSDSTQPVVDVLAGETEGVELRPGRSHRPETAGPDRRTLQPDPGTARRDVRGATARDARLVELERGPET